MRAHPLLMQLLMSPLYGRASRTRQAATSPRLRHRTVVLVYLLGRVLYDGRVARLAALLLAVMPYHVIVGRQIMLDGPMAFFTTAALLCLASAPSATPAPAGSSPPASPSAWPR